MFMKLVHNQIPVEFLTELPDGVKLVKRKGHEFLVIEEVMSPGGQSLMSEDVRIHGEPAIKLHVVLGGSEGTIYVDAFWGSHAKLYSFVPEVRGTDQMIDATAPETRENLMVDYQCDVQGCSCTRAVQLLLPGRDNRILVCARMGCPGHRMVLARMSHVVSDTISGINFFGAGTPGDDWFEDFA